jgi:hypothetical protein
LNKMGRFQPTKAGLSDSGNHQQNFLGKKRCRDLTLRSTLTRAHARSGLLLIVLMAPVVDCVIIGAGLAGLQAARRLADEGVSGACVVRLSPILANDKPPPPQRLRAAADAPLCVCKCRRAHHHHLTVVASLPFNRSQSSCSRPEITWEGECLRCEERPALPLPTHSTTFFYPKAILRAVLCVCPSHALNSLWQLPPRPRDFPTVGGPRPLAPAAGPRVYPRRREQRLEGVHRCAGVGVPRIRLA